MQYIWQHIRRITGSYDGALPLAHFLKAHFRKNPRLGSRDRKILSGMAYCWYRAARGFGETSGFEQKVAACLSVCGETIPHARDLLPEHPDRRQTGFNINALLDADIACSDGIDRGKWLASMLRQPDLFIRLRKNEEQTIRILRENGIAFRAVSDRCLALPNATPADRLLPADAYVVQDASSQRTGDYLRPANGERWWDCCAGAGGKSLLLKDSNGSIDLTVSDKRDTILYNLQERFRLYAHDLPRILAVDVADARALQEKMGDAPLFDNIICDVPCTGSGTWARTPEQLYFFRESSVKEYTARQKNIASNALIYLKPGGRLFYITCSVFREENEEVVDYVRQQKNVITEHMTSISGVEERADSMFLAVLRNA